MAKQIKNRIAMGGNRRGKLTASKLTMLTMTIMANSYGYIPDKKDEPEQWSAEDVKRNLLKGTIQ